MKVPTRIRSSRARRVTTRALPDAAIAALQQQIASAPAATDTVQMDNMGGAYAAVGAADSAFAHRQALFDIQLEAYWLDAAAEPAHRAWVQSTRAAITPYTDGA